MLRRLATGAPGRFLGLRRLDLTPLRVAIPSNRGQACHIRDFASGPETKAKEGFKTEKVASGPERAAQEPAKLKIDKPTYQLTFTCKVCDERSSHLVSRQAYHHGTVLIQCPSCKNRHLISDHLKIFNDKSVTLDDILAKNGDTVTKAAIDPSQVGDLQWEDPNPEDTKTPALQ